MATEKILVEIEVVQNRLKDTEDNIKKIGGALKELKKDEENNAAAIKATESELRVYNQRLKEEQRFIDATVKANTAKEGSLEQLKAQYAANTKALNQMTVEEIQNTQEGQDLVAQNLKINTTLKELEASYGQNARNVGNYDAAVKPLKTQLRELNMQMQQLAVEGKEDSEMFKKLQADAGRMREVMDDVSESVKRLANNPLEITLNGIMEGARGVAAGFALAQSASVLFGEENKALQETMVKLQATMLLLNSLSEIQQILRKESALSTLFATSATAANTVATYANAAATAVLNTSMGLANSLMRLLGVSTVATTGAFIALTTVIAATGIGAIVLAIGYLGTELVKTVGELYSAITATDKLTKSQSQLRMELEATNNVYEKYIDLIKIQSGEADRVTANNIALAKSIGASEGQILKIKENGLKTRLAFIEQERRRTIAYWAQLAKADVRLLTQVAQNQGNLIAVFSDTNAKRTEDETKAIETLIKLNQESEDIKVDILVQGNEAKLKAQQEYAKKVADGLKALQELENKFLSNNIAYQTEQLAKKYANDIAIAKDNAALRLAIENQYILDVAALYRKQREAENLANTELDEADMLHKQAIIERVKMVEQAKLDIYNLARDERMAGDDAELENLKKRQDQQIAIIQQTSDAINLAFTNSITEAGIDLQKFSKQFLAIMIDSVEKQLLLLTAPVIAQAVAQLGPIAGAAASAALLGTIKAAFSLAKAAAVGTFEDGGVVPEAANGLLVGPSHAKGGIKINTPGGMIEAEGGEAIINKRSTAMFKPILSAINEAGGGVKFANGGMVGTMPQTDFSLMAMADMFNSMPQPVVAVTDINKVSNKMKLITVKSTL
jgi:hypothetical protein